MSTFKQIYKPLLAQADWQSSDQVKMADAVLASWLHEQGSLSRRFARDCHQFSVLLLEQSPIKSAQLQPGEQQMLGRVDCLERNVVLQGDGIPWVFARTLIPLPTLTGDEQDLAQLGELPLGYRVFTDQSARRDALQLAEFRLEGESLWARRSRLWVKEKPMLVAELFLSAAPVYPRKAAQDGNPLPSFNPSISVTSGR
ncbi:chorismate lyase [Photobacterium sp. GJ3]|uniref:chorismate--pyruvate lyase family protein n=1 Tax=Photobacterium sp. GJ3 TaxID=2829502 RepID=UPI001B8A8E56|nr:chorismate lyase [Photobacterium sp. GJ3]QUJ67343.1 chorismate lyase [Photobacterium sp. GJ3]